jgi:hypothetical protein
MVADTTVVIFKVKQLWDIIIITGKTSLFEPQPSLEDPVRLVYSIVNWIIWFSLLWISQQ